MLHFGPSSVPASSHLGSPISCGKFVFPKHRNKKKLLRCALNRLQSLPAPLLRIMKRPNLFSWLVLTFLHFILGKHGQPKALPMLHFEPSSVPSIRSLEVPSHVFLFPTHLSNKKLLRCALDDLRTLPAPLLET